MDYNSKIVMLKGADGAGITDIKKTSTNVLTDTYTITLSDGKKHNFDVTNGAKGEKGDTGPQGPKGEKGDTGSITIDATLSDTSTNPVQNKVITNSVNDVRGQIRTNLLNPTSKTQTINGVTFTNNGDGTYTVNGTCTGTTTMWVTLEKLKFEKNMKVKLIGTPPTSTLGNKGCLELDANTQTIAFDVGKGVVADVDNENIYYIYIRMEAGVIFNNLLFKPMITTDLSATYDDFVPYTGDSGRLNEDVADLVDSVKGISAITNSDIDTILNS